MRTRRYDVMMRRLLMTRGGGMIRREVEGKMEYSMTSIYFKASKRGEFK